MALDQESALAAARRGDESAFGELIAPLRKELESHCYRMVGSLAEAEDLVQETTFKAWRGLPSFEGRSSLRAWLYKIATHACIDTLSRRSPRFSAVETRPPGGPAERLPEPTNAYVDPCPDGFWQSCPAGPEARVAAREAVTLAFLSALEHLTPIQRATLLLRDVLGWSASEVATMLDRSTAAVESALERARATTATRRTWSEAPEVIDGAKHRELLERYLAAWEAADAGALTALLRDDARLTMPPFPLWLAGRQAIHDFLAPILATQGPLRARSIGIAGASGFAGWVKPQGGERFHAHALTSIGTSDGQIAQVDTYLVPALFARFSLPLELV